MGMILKSSIQLFFAVAIVTLTGCSETPPEVVEMSEPFKVTINHYFKNEPLSLNNIYQGAQNRDLWITKKKYYLSNVSAITTEGKNELIADVVLIEIEPNSHQVSFTGDLPKGNYTAISFDLGVREDLNLNDPATYNIDHPLSVSNNMYWGWSTQYIFSKFEGREVLNDDTTSFVIHTGTTSLYRPKIIVQRVFNVTNGGSSVSIGLDLFSILSNSEYTFDLSSDGQSHTTDNVPLAVNYMDNFTVAFQ